MDLRNNEDDRPYRGVNRAQYSPMHTQEQQDDSYGYDDTMTTQAYYRERLRGVTEQRWFPLAAVTVGVILFGTLIAFAYRQGADTGSNGATPLIQAENGSYKEKPQTPGGMDVPFQDAVVFDQIDATKTADAGGTVENLLPPPEQPADMNNFQPPAKTAADTLPSAPKESADKGVIAGAENNDSVADKIAATETNLKAKTAGGTAADGVRNSGKQNSADTAALNEATAATMQISSAQSTVEPALVAETPSVTTKNVTTKIVTEKTAAAKAIPPKATATAAGKTTTADAVKAATVTAAAVPVVTASATPTKMNAVAPAAPTPAPARTGGAAKVQLGAFKDEAAARSAWASLQKQHAPHLNGVTPNYARADLGAKGVFYRVQGVNLSVTQAKDICSAINATKPGACIIPQ